MTEGRNHVAVPGSEKESAPGAEVIGDAPAEERMDVTVRVRRRQELPELQIHTGQAQTHMSVEEYAANFGADPADLQKVEEFAHRYGLIVEVSDGARRSVLLSGTVAAFRQAFDVDLKTYRHAGGVFRGRTGAIYVPADLGEIVTGVFGLDDRPFARPHYRLCSNTKRAAVGVQDAAFPTGFFPTEVARLYNFPTTATGRGETIGIIELGGGFRPEELRSYFSQLGLPTLPNVAVANLPGLGSNRPGIDPLDPANPDVEVMLDIEVIGAAAPGANLVVYFAPDAQDQSFIDVMTAAVSDTIHRPSILSISWGGPEASATKQFQDNFDQVLQTAAHLGITVCVASGDNGSADFPLDDPQRPWDGRAHVDFPASSPHALSCGGTRLSVSNGSILGEVVWHPSPNEGTGGGVSRFFPLPDYQTDAGVPHAQNPVGPVKRGVPDVAGDAAQESGYRVLCDGQWFPDPAKGLPPIGGTSAVAPLWAGLIALINESLGRRVGFINPALYALPPASGAFNDIIQGDNGDYEAGSGWDPCTGLGSPNGQKLLDALRN